MKSSISLYHAMFERKKRDQKSHEIRRICRGVSSVELALVLDELQRSSEFMKQVTQWHVSPARSGHYEEMPAWLHPELQASLLRRGVSQLYSHQAEALNLLRVGRHVMVVTPTASGKTLCYNAPVLDTVLKDGNARALYLFPTKALSQDQVAELHELAAGLRTQVQSFTYDGDTPIHARQRIREASQVVVTNPDMLHAAILPHHTKWLRLFENLRYVVIDEAHMYRGVFGSHVANVLRRLRRICAFYGSHPQFILSSATVANPTELGRDLIGDTPVVIDQSGAPQGERHTVFYNPPVVQPQLGLRRSSLQEARRWGTRLLNQGVSTIAFVKTRTQVELLASYWKQGVREGVRQQVFGYRGGYLPNERRQIEQGLRRGEIRGVVSTNALELGVDIGSLEVAISVGYPGSIASLRQQSGRAGRRQGLSLALMIANASPLDQYVAHHATQILAASPEAARVYPENLLILMDHLKCAAYELPFSAEESFAVETIGEMLEYMVAHRVLHRGNDGRYYWMSDALPSHEVSLRSAAQNNVVIIDRSEGRSIVIGEMDRFSALTMLHDEAIYLHQSKSYQVERLDLANGKAFVQSVAADYYTDAELAVRLQVLDVLAESENEGVAHRSGELMVNALPTLFKKIKLDSHENLGWGKIHLPEAELHTTGYWCAWHREQFAEFDNQRWESALLGTGHVLRHAAALHCMCNVTDLHMAVEIRDVLQGLPTVYLYDAYPGGVGLGERVYRDRQRVLASASAMVAECDCESGCPSCIGPSLEGGVDRKQDVLKLLQVSLGEVVTIGLVRTSDQILDAVPQDEEGEEPWPGH